MSLTSYHHAIKAPAPGAPLVFAFHGTGGDEHQFFGLIEQLSPGAGIIAPRGDVLEQGAARFFRRTGEGVYDMADLAQRTLSMAAFVRAQRAAHPGHPVLGLGYSNGANILTSVLLEDPGLFDGAALMHPLIPWQPEDVPGLAGKRLLVTAGRRDPICPAPLTERLIDYLTRQGADVAALWHEGGHEIRQQELTAIGSFLKI